MQEEKPHLSHTWAVAATIEVTPKIASVADYRGSFKVVEGQRIEALDVYCDGCRRPHDEVKGDDCAAKSANTHLIGGDQTKHAKRKALTQPVNGSSGQGMADFRAVSVTGGRSRNGFFGPKNIGRSMSGEKRRVAGFSRLMTSSSAPSARGLRAPVATARSTKRAKYFSKAVGGVSVAPG